VAKQSAGLLLYREHEGRLEVLLVHPGGPFWARRDEGAWSIPKGEFEAGEDPLDAARREFEEETGFAAPGGAKRLVPLEQPGGKTVHAWAVRGDLDADGIVSNTFEMEWPPRSGRRQAFPEVDRAAWFTIPEARRKILPGQAGFLEELERSLGDLDSGDYHGM